MRDGERQVTVRTCTPSSTRSQSAHAHQPCHARRPTRAHTWCGMPHRGVWRAIGYDYRGRMRRLMVRMNSTTTHFQFSFFQVKSKLNLSHMFFRMSARPDLAAFNNMSVRPAAALQLDLLVRRIACSRRPSAHASHQPVGAVHSAIVHVAWSCAAVRCSRSRGTRGDRLHTARTGAHTHAVVGPKFGDAPIISAVKRRARAAGSLC